MTETEEFSRRISDYKLFGMRGNFSLTGVRQAYKGRGLGKMLKAEMLLYIRREYPDVKYISTGNADSNAPMLSINQRLGFKKYRPIKVYKLKLSHIIPPRV